MHFLVVVEALPGGACNFVTDRGEPLFSMGRGVAPTVSCGFLIAANLAADMGRADRDAGRRRAFALAWKPDAGVWSVVSDDGQRLMGIGPHRHLPNEPDAEDLLAVCRAAYNAFR